MKLLEMVLGSWEITLNLDDAAFSLQSSVQMISVSFGKYCYDPWNHYSLNGIEVSSEDAFHNVQKGSKPK